MPENPSPEPLRTVEHPPPPEAPATVDETGAYQPAGETEPHAPAPPADAPSIPGYAITAEIARGGMGRVYAGRDLTLDREVAIKTLLPGADAGRFVTEARITARLPHPGIPPVHALGTLGDGSPYLAMKLIRGRALADLLQGRSSPRDDLPRFVQVFEQIAQAVGFAHAQGIIHRDLKPLNIMAGAFGEVQVMDWGLAKDVQSRHREGVDGRAGSDDPTHTVAGAVMGTPGYVAPEQARGEVVDARADVFALGSTLAAILTGRPAFVGTSTPETIDKAARADLAEVMARLDVCGADADLVTVARRCLAANAGDRPADARAVAADVAAYRAGVEARLRQAETQAAEALVRVAEQRKRRRQLLLAAGAVTLTLLAGLGASLWQMNRAISAEGQARDNEQQAIANEQEAIIERDAKARALVAETKARAAERQARDKAMAALRAMTDEIVENQMARGRGQTLTEENKAFLRTILKQFEGFAAITADDAESRSIRAEGLYRVGRMRGRLGELKEAEAAFTNALAIHKQLAADFPNRTDFRQNLAHGHASLGRLLSTTGRPKEAEAAYADALAINKQLAADFPNRLSVRDDLARSHLSLGILLSDTGRPKEAEAAFTNALAIHKQLAADFPNRTDFRQNLAHCHANLGNLLITTGRAKEAEAALRDALVIKKQLAADFPTRPDFRQELAGSHNSLSVLLRTTGRPREAEAALRDALTIQKQLAANFPTRPVFRQELAGSHNSLGLLLRNTGRLKEAEAALRDSLVIKKQLAADFPNQSDLRNSLAGTYVNLANFCNQRGDPAAAKGYLVEAGPHHAAALKANPRHPAYRQFYRNNLWALTRAHAGLLEPAEAVRAAETIRDLGWDPPANAYDAAGALCLCIPVVAKHDDLDADQRKQAVRFYGDEAMKLLRGAVNKGFGDVKHLKRDGIFAPLRRREDFRKLVAGLEGKAAARNSGPEKPPLPKKE
jgi:tetratricopeptide (TPR) repeat protein